MILHLGSILICPHQYIFLKDIWNSFSHGREWFFLPNHCDGWLVHEKYFIDLCWISQVKYYSCLCCRSVLYCLWAYVGTNSFYHWWSYSCFFAHLHTLMRLPVALHFCFSFLSSFSCSTKYCVSIIFSLLGALLNSPT